eukprot:TRINITY_DN2524_c0_g1_i1.p1 TRINITY_DN2524_c0_g1~~TRINITY_DN2524_c0_g1_i1.p1  ORF type:complete len:301 (-),score=38.11 TRINITY_DN2524_c0_g1_i1:103-1005(-)
MQVSEPGFAWLASGSQESFVITNPQSGIWPHTQPLLCSNYSTYYKADRITLRTNQYLVPYIYHNPHYHASLKELANGTDLFVLLAKFLLRPQHELLQQRDEFIQRHYTGNYVIGLQVRTGHDFTDNFMLDNEWLLYKNCALGDVPQALQNKIKFFVATDTQRGRDMALRIFGRNQTLFFGEFLISNNPRGVKQALLDILLLVASNDRVHTAWSTFGYTAAGMAGRPAWLVTAKPPARLAALPGEEQRYMGIPHKSDKRQQCVKLHTANPCFHKFWSWGAATVSCFSESWRAEEATNNRYC